MSCPQALSELSDCLTSDPYRHEAISCCASPIWVHLSEATCPSCIPLLILERATAVRCSDGTRCTCSQAHFFFQSPKNPTHPIQLQPLQAIRRVPSSSPMLIFLPHHVGMEVSPGSCERRRNNGSATKQVHHSFLATRVCSSPSRRGRSLGRLAGSCPMSIVCLTSQR